MGYQYSPMLVRVMIESGGYTSFNDLWKIAPAIRTGLECGIHRKRMREIMNDVTLLRGEEIKKLAAHFGVSLKVMRSLVNEEKQIQKGKLD